MKSWKEVKKELEENGVEKGRLMYVDKRKGGRRRKIILGNLKWYRGKEWKKEKEIMLRNGFELKWGKGCRGGGYWSWVRFEKEE